MSRYIIVYVLFATILAPAAFSQDAKAIVRLADQKMKGNSSYAVIKITTVRKTYSREMSARVFTKGNDLALIEILSPAKDKGIKFLRRNKEVWNWIPSIERTIKLPPSMMNQSWMGTDFTNDDLVKEASIIDDYQHSITGKDKISNRNCHQITLIPLPTAAVVWGKIILYIDEKENIILAADYYDEDGILTNHMLASDLKVFSGRLIPSRMEMTPIGKPENKTVLIYEELKFDLPLDESIFLPNTLQQTR
jgi:outer membrane lipoprotein-sorting protein